ncbi:MAG: universal stress protein [Deltaproteobacteria bacterium]
MTTASPFERAAPLMPAATQQPYRVVAACDFSPLGDRAVVEALRLCSAYSGAELHVITVGAELTGGLLLPGADVSVVGNEAAQQVSRVHVARIVDQLVAGGQALSIEKIAVYAVAGTPSERIVALATTVDADLIVLGTHSRHGLGRLLLGSVAQEVLRRAPCGVFVIRPRDFLDGEKVPEIQPPLGPDDHALLPFRGAPTYHYLHRMNQEADRMMPSI